MLTQQNVNNSKQAIWFGRSMLAAAWILALVAAFLPAYRGEFLSPGSVTTVPGILWLIGPVVFLAAALTQGYVSVLTILHILAVLVPSLLFLLTPLTLVPGVSRRPRLLGIAGVGLVLAGCIWLAGTAIYDPSPNQLLVGAYLLPFPLLIAGVGLCLLGYGAPPATRDRDEPRPQQR